MPRYLSIKSWEFRLKIYSFSDGTKTTTNMCNTMVHFFSQKNKYIAQKNEGHWFTQCYRCFILHEVPTKKYVVFEFLLCYFRRSYPKQFYILCLYYRHFFMSFLGFLAANKEKSTDFFSVFVFGCEYMWNKKMNIQRRKKNHVGIQKKSRRSFGC